MNRTDEPTKQPKPFGINGQREDILPTTPAGDNTASYESGFPPITMILKSAGGLPPKGQDINQILYELSALGRWSSSGVMNTFDSSFATAIGGYPSGSFVLGDDLKTVYRCTADGNTANPNSVTTGWTKVAQDVADILSLGTAAYRDVGTGTNQIPDMSTFTYSTSGGISIYRFPNRMCVQRGNSSTDSSGGAVVSLPVAMTEFTPIIVEGLVSNWTGTGNVYDFFTVYGAQGTTTTTFLAKSASYRGIDGKFIAQATNFNWIAIGTI